MFGYIYLIIDQKENKLYVGQKIGHPDNSNNYYGSGKVIKQIIKKRGTYFLKKIILGSCDSQEELDDCEIECISFFNTKDFNYGYNLTNGGGTTTGLKMSEESKQKISESASKRNKINWSDPKFRQHMKEIQNSDEYKRKMSLSCLGNKSRTGMKNNEESNIRRSKKLTGIKRSKETKQNMKNAALKRWAKEKNNG